MGFPTCLQPGSFKNNFKNSKKIRRILIVCFLLLVVLLASVVTGFFDLVVVSIVLVVIVLTLCLCCYSSADEGENLIDHVPGMPKRFSVRDLESATGNFCEGDKLGRGGFGSVFKGTLQNGTIGAVKQLGQSSGQGLKEFLAEVKTIGSVHHFNLVKLVGFCAENSHKLLVYEFMSYGSLDRWIFNVNQQAILAWPTRSKIILHISKALAYLHQECSPGIIHLDIKPQNVLLDSDFNAKLSDFGLAKFICRDQSRVETAARGTPGYMAPELLTGIGISGKVDVYSFGIVILEIVCGRKNLDSSQPEEEDGSILSLLGKVKRMTEEDELFDVADKRIGDMLQNKGAVVKMIKLAIWCSMNDSRRRPSMSRVVKVLEDDMEFEDKVDSILGDSFFPTHPVELRLEVNGTASAPLLAEVLSGPR